MNFKLICVPPQSVAQFTSSRITVHGTAPRLEGQPPKITFKVLLLWVLLKIEIFYVMCQSFLISFIDVERFFEAHKHTNHQQAGIEGRKRWKSPNSHSHRNIFNVCKQEDTLSSDLY